MNNYAEVSLSINSFNNYSNKMQKKLNSNLLFLFL